ncbi:hypothetical protein GF324_09170 [bacterium]|nr:hypothetical protein [bacterium]
MTIDALASAMSTQAGMASQMMDGMEQASQAAQQNSGAGGGSAGLNPTDSVEISDAAVQALAAADA